MLRRTPLALLLVLHCDRPAARRPPEPPAPRAPDASPDAASSGAPDAAPDARVPARLTVTVKNTGQGPIRIRTNQDRNELVRAVRLNVSPGTSDRAALFAQGTRVSLFPIGRMPLCTSDAGAGYGGLGQPEDVYLQPNESLEVAAWDGVQREEVLDPQRGVCARELPPQPGRYRVGLDQGESGDYFPVCDRALFAWPPSPEAGALRLELHCRPPTTDAGRIISPPAPRPVAR
ncbi:MAG: hypothetical protein HY909_04075 [Deltaproteobacteria bacterium]|nr:hypothetical protein [Deltaproteobacteria bacterium]